MERHSAITADEFIIFGGRTFVEVYTITIQSSSSNRHAIIGVRGYWGHLLNLFWVFLIGETEQSILLVWIHFACTDQA